MIWGTCLGLLAVGTMLGYVFRQDIVERVPATASLYKAVGINVTLNGLEFAEVSSKNLRIDGASVLVINGNIKNTLKTPTQIPPVTFSFIGPEGDILTEWHVEIDDAELDAKQIRSFSAQYPNPPLEAASLRYKFSDDIHPQILEAQTPSPEQISTLRVSSDIATDLDTLENKD